MGMRAAARRTPGGPPKAEPDGLGERDAACGRSLARRDLTVAGPDGQRDGPPARGNADAHRDAASRPILAWRAANAAAGLSRA